MVDDIEERKLRLESFLDKYGLPKGRKRSSALVEILDCTPFTARRILGGNLPRAETMRKLITLCQCDSENTITVNELVNQVFYGGLKENNIFVMAYSASAIEKKAIDLGINFADFKSSIRENLWMTVYDDAVENDGQVNHKVVNALLANLVKNFNEN